MKIHIPAAALALVLLPRIALPCSLVPPSVTAPIAENTGNQPLLISENLGATLQDDQGNVIAVEPWNPSVNLRGAGGVDIIAVRPAEPLSAGTYVFGQVTIVITSSQAPALPILQSGSLRVFSHEEDTFEAGCGGGMSSCGNFSGLTVSIMNSETPADKQGYLLTLTNEDGLTAHRLIADEFGGGGSPQTDLRFYDSFPEFGKIGDEGLCATVNIVSSDGELGPTLDAGCFVPEGSGGCVSTRGSSSLPTLSLLLVGLGLGFVRRRRN